MKEQEQPRQEIERLRANVPEELQAYAHFVVWKYTEIAGKLKKPPINPKTGYLASSVNPNTWGTFAQALKAFQTGKFNGIGFTFAESDPFTGIDIDHCVLNNKLTPQASELVTDFSSYAELSPSHEGLHIIVKGTVPEGKRKDTLEVYSTGRYFTITTNHLKGTPNTIEDRQPQLDRLYASLTSQEANRQTIHTQEHQLYVSDEKVLEKAENARNGSSFTSLYHGNIGGYTSKSEADFELVLRLLYWTNDDAEQVQRLFRRSGLYDDKTDRATNGITYLEVTIANALKKRQKR